MKKIIPILLALASTTLASESDTVEFMFMGDIMLDRIPGKYVARGKDPFEHIAPLLKSADFRIGNVEYVASPKRVPPVDKVYTFWAPTTTLDPIAKHLNAISLANNHTGDYGHDSLVAMLSELKTRGIAYFGAGRNYDEAHAPLIVEKNGINIAILGYNEFRPRSFEAGPNTPGVAWSDDAAVLEDIKKVRPKVDLVLTFMHWGEEYVSHPNERQRSLARMMIDAGVDVVIGGHSHINQGAEFYRGKLIVYSLGNFVFDDFADSYRENRLELRELSRTSWMLRLKLNRDGLVDWKTFVTRTGEDGFPRLVAGAESPSAQSPFPSHLIEPLPVLEPESPPVVPKIPCTASTKSQRCIDGYLQYVNVEMVRIQTTRQSLESDTMSDTNVYQLDKDFFRDAELTTGTQVIDRYTDDHCRIVTLDYNIRDIYPDPNKFEFGLNTLNFSSGNANQIFPIANFFRDAPREPFSDAVLLTWLKEQRHIEINGTGSDRASIFRADIPIINIPAVKVDDTITPGKDFNIQLTGFSGKEQIRLSTAGYNTMRNLGYYVACEYQQLPASGSITLTAKFTAKIPLGDIPQKFISFGIETYRHKVLDHLADITQMVVIERNDRVAVEVPVSVK